MGNIKSSEYTKRNFKYHTVFTTKYRRQIFYEEKRKKERFYENAVNGSQLISGSRILPQPYPHVAGNIPKMNVPSFMGYLKGKITRMIHERFCDLKFKHRKREFWCRGYHIDTVGKNTKKIQESIWRQRAQDKQGGPLSILYPSSPFTAGK